MNKLLILILILLVLGLYFYTDITKDAINLAGNFISDKIKGFERILG
tara:strand:- start:7923 stop:8063 length:141 start_codon:yes stop_codon:yes gene_type:complete